MPPTVNEQIQADIDKIEAAIGGVEGINVRLARVEDGLRVHRDASAAAHATTQAELVALRKEVAELKLACASGWRVSVDPASSRVIAGVLFAVLSAFLGGGGLRGVLDELVHPAGAQQQPPAVVAPVVDEP